MACWIYEGDPERVLDGTLSGDLFSGLPRALQAFIAELCAGVAPEHRACVCETAAHAWLFASYGHKEGYSKAVERGELAVLSAELPDGEPIDLVLQRDGGYVDVFLLAAPGPLFASPPDDGAGLAALGQARLRLETRPSERRSRPVRRRTASGKRTATMAGTANG